MLFYRTGELFQSIAVGKSRKNIDDLMDIRTEKEFGESTVSRILELVENASSRKCISIVKQNIIFSLAVKFGCLALVAPGLANIWLGIFADVGVIVLAVINAIRARRR